MPRTDEYIGVISSVIVRARPEDLSDAACAISRLPGAELHGDDPSGKLIVVLETDDEAELNDVIAEIGNLKGVLAVNMVFHHNESAPADDYNGSWRG